MAIVEFALQETKSIQKETQKWSSAQWHKLTRWDIISAENSQILSFQYHSLEVLSHACQGRAFHIKTDLKSKKV